LTLRAAAVSEAGRTALKAGRNALFQVTTLSIEFLFPASL
jgi:hypothetical protein